MFYISRQPVADSDRVKHIVVVDHTPKQIVDNHLESQISTLHDNDFHLVAFLASRSFVANIFVQLCGAHYSLGLIVKIHIHDIVTALLNVYRLLSEWDKQIFQNAPIHKSANRPYRFSTQKPHFANLQKRTFGSCHKATSRIAIYENALHISYFQFLRSIFLRHQDFAIFFTIKIKTEVNFFYDLKFIVVSNFYHIFTQNIC